MLSLKSKLKNIIRSFLIEDELSSYGKIPEDIPAGAPDELKNQNIVFFITPGRSGTKTLIKYLVANSDLVAIHAPTPWLATVGSLFWLENLNEEAAQWSYYSCRERYLQFSFQRNRAFVDGDCKNLPLLPALVDFFPNSKFVHVVRDPTKFVCSGLDRGYFKDKDPILWGHLFAGKHEPKAIDFKRQVELIADFWETSNSIAAEVSKKAGPSRFCLIKSESMFSDSLVIQKAFEEIKVGTFSPCGSGSLEVSNGNKRKKKYNEAVINEIIALRCPSAKKYYPEKFSQ